MSVSILLISCSWKGHNECVSVLWFHYLAFSLSRKTILRFIKDKWWFQNWHQWQFLRRTSVFFFPHLNVFLLHASTRQSVRSREGTHMALRATARHEMLRSGSKVSVRVGNCCHYQENGNELWSRPAEQDPEGGQFLEMIAALKGHLQVRLSTSRLLRAPRWHWRRQRVPPVCASSPDGSQASWFGFL